MAPRRILVGPLPALLSDLVRQLLSDATEFDVSLVPAQADLVSAATAAGAHVVLTTLADANASELSRQLQHAIVVALDPRGRHAMCYAAGAVAARVDDLSPLALRHLIDGSEAR